jgi:hypothetical protein
MCDGGLSALNSKLKVPRGQQSHGPELSGVPKPVEALGSTYAGSWHGGPKLAGSGSPGACLLVPAY